MATTQKVIEMIAAIKTVYPYYAKDADMKVLVGLWESLLKDYQDSVVSAAFKKKLQTCKMPPTPADVIEHIQNIANAEKPSMIEIWDVFCTALRESARKIYYFPMTYIDGSGMSQGDRARMEFDNIWNNLPEELKIYLSSKNNLMYMAKTYTDDDLRFEKTRFERIFPTIQKRMEYKQLLAEHNNKLLEGQL